MYGHWLAVTGCLLSLLVQAGMCSTVQDDLEGDCGMDPTAPIAFGSPGVVRKRLKQAEIIPDVLDDLTKDFFVHIHWRESEVSAWLGNDLSPSQLQSSPDVWLSLPASKRPPAADWDSPYRLELRDNSPASSSGIIFPANLVVALTDPDAPSRENPEWSQVCHWLFSAYCSNVALHGRLSQSMLPLIDTVMEGSDCEIADLMPYKPPGPPKGTGRHRYTFVVLMPVNNTDVRLNLTVPGERKHWGYGEKWRAGVREWAAENGLEPIAANFVYAQSDE